MSVYIKEFDSSNEELYQIAMSIRYEVFVKELGVDEFLELDEYDVESVHLLAFHDDIPVGTARFRTTMEGIKLERFSVLKPFRKLKIGELLLVSILNRILPTPKLIYAHAQKDAVSFYEKYDFHVIGEMFFEANLQHFMMIYNKNK